MKIEYKRSARKTLCIQIGRDGTVYVRMPYRMSKAYADRFLASRMGWIEKNLEKRKAQSAGVIPFSEEEKAAFLLKMKASVEPKVRYYAKMMGVSYGKIKIGFQKSKWGSCTKEGNLSFNALLGAVPEAVLDYVIVHELAHRKEMNHSTRFYSEVEKILPYYKEARKWLKDNGRGLILRAFPLTGEKETK